MLFICPELVRKEFLKKGLELDKKDNKFAKIGINMSINNPGGFSNLLKMEYGEIHYRPREKTEKT